MYALYTVWVRMSTSGIFIHYIGGGCQSPNFQEIHRANGNFVFILCHIFKEHIPGIK
jgi:hypothetical protein